MPASFLSPFPAWFEMLIHRSASIIAWKYSHPSVYLLFSYKYTHTYSNEYAIAPVPSKGLFLF